jgi:fluoroacetyl-CoA thioesterase
VVNAKLERARLLRQKSPVNGKYCASDKERSYRTSSRDAGGRQRRDHCNPSRGVAGSRLTFDVQAIDGSGQLVAAGQIDRAIVDRQRLLASVSADAGHQ